MILDPLVHDPTMVALDAIDVGHASLSTDSNAVDRLLHPAGRPDITTVLVLAHDNADAADADARVLLDLAELRTAIPTTTRPRSVIELRDVTSISLVDFEGTDDYVISDAIGSRFIAQLSELPERRRVYLDLYDSIDPSLRLEPADRFGLSGNFTADEVFRVAYEAGFTAFGWRAASEPDGGVVLNPRVSRRVELRSGDQIVVVG